ncbi:MAG: TfoX/Sxy family protein [Deltaproteobacteria bacterium]|jgi:TfoX/Sxy family transcriptional regulator of competence genes|nr:TfoX/Sxy family protein [Deltaproteobacteria bacterium]
MSKWKAVTPEHVALFDSCLPSGLGIERRAMFGCPCAFVNGNMFAGVHETRFLMRLSPEDRERLLVEPDAGPFVVLGRTMREYVTIEAPERRDPAELAGWIARAFAFASALPPKQAKPRKKRVAAEGPSPRRRRS